MSVGRATATVVLGFALTMPVAVVADDCVEACEAEFVNNCVPFQCERVDDGVAQCLSELSAGGQQFVRAGCVIGCAFSDDFVDRAYDICERLSEDGPGEGGSASARFGTLNATLGSVYINGDSGCDVPKSAYQTLADALSTLVVNNCKSGATTEDIITLQTACKDAPAEDLCKVQIFMTGMNDMGSFVAIGNGAGGHQLTFTGAVIDAGKVDASGNSVAGFVVTGVAGGTGNWPADSGTLSDFCSTATNCDGATFTYSSLTFHGQVVQEALDAGLKVILLGHPHPRNGLATGWTTFMANHAEQAAASEDVWFIDTRVDPFPTSSDLTCTDTCALYYAEDDSHPSDAFVTDFATPLIKEIYDSIVASGDLNDDGDSDDGSGSSTDNSDSSSDGSSAADNDSDSGSTVSSIIGPAFVTLAWALL